MLRTAFEAEPLDPNPALWHGVIFALFGQAAAVTLNK